MKKVRESKEKVSIGQKLALALDLFLSYFKIGLFTFGGGYAMIALIDREFVQKKKWISEVELYEIIAVAESTPGPIAINCATFVGNKILGFWGSLLSTIAVCIPSFVIIYLISIFYDTFMSLTVIANAFKGIQVAIAVMISTAGFNMLKKGKKNAFAWTVFGVTFVLACVIDIFSLDFSTIYLILMGAICGIVLQGVRDIIAKNKNNKDNADNLKNKSEDTSHNDIDNTTNDNNACESKSDDKDFCLGNKYFDTDMSNKSYDSKKADNIACNIENNTKNTDLTSKSADTCDDSHDAEEGEL